MKRLLLYAALVLVACVTAITANAQKRGGTLRVFQYDSPASMSIHEEALNSAQNPMMSVFNNLVLFKQDVPQNRIDTIVSDLATKWSWNSEMTELTFQLLRGVQAGESASQDEYSMRLCHCQGARFNDVARNLVMCDDIR